MFKLPNLPYSTTALEPFLSEETFDYHYGKHHKSYVDKTNALIAGTAFEKMSLEQVIMRSSGALFDNASQAWNHTFYWKCMRSLSEDVTSSIPSQRLIRQVNQDFGSILKFKENFNERVMQLFGSGWVWLVMDSDRRLQILSLSNAESPLRTNLIPILTCDVWEHSYYIDYRNNRKRYVDGFLEAINWSFVAENFECDHFPNLTQYRVERVPKSTSFRDSGIQL